MHGAGAQGFQNIPDATSVLMPNDTLITICSFNTSADTKYNTTYGSLPTQEVRGSMEAWKHGSMVEQSRV